MNPSNEIKVNCNGINSLYAYSFTNYLNNASLADTLLLDSKGNPIEIITTVYRVRILFTSTTVLMSIIGGISILSVFLISSIVVTLKSRK